MKRLLVALCALILFWPSVAMADETDTNVDVVVIEFDATPSPDLSGITPPPATPTPTPLPELPEYDYDASWARALSRGMWSVCPRNPTPKTKRAFGELVLNRVADDSGDFDDTPSTVLTQGNEFMDYKSDAFRSIENDELAVYVLRACTYAEVTGNWSYRLVPSDGLYCDFYNLDGFDYIKIYNRAGDTVYDSGARQ